MARTALNDPLEKFRFQVDFTLPGVAANPLRTGFHDVQMPKRSTNKIMYREGHNPDINSVSAGLSTMEDIVLSNGVLPGDGNLAQGANDLYKWMSTVHVPTAGLQPFDTATGVATLQTTKLVYRTTVTIRMLDRAGTTVRAWRCHQAWPTNFVPGSDLSASEDGDKSLQSLTLCYEDFQELQVTGGTLGAELT